MRLALSSLIVVLLFASRLDADELSMPSSIAPSVQGASAAETNGAVFVHLISTRIVPMQQARQFLRDGEKVEEKYTVNNPVFESKAIALGKDIKAFTRDGKELESESVLERLKNPTPVVITPDGKLDPFYKPLFRDDVVVLMPVGIVAPVVMPAGIAAPMAPAGVVMPTPQPVYGPPPTFAPSK
jgi:hypothetical protein